VFSPCKVRLRTSPILSPPLPVATASLGSPSQFLIATKTETTIASPHIPTFKTFSASDFTMDNQIPISWWKQTTKLWNSPSETKRSEKYGCTGPNSTRSSNL
jgi:hypothetical protein